jgi:hypothetical protein
MIQDNTKAKFHLSTAMRLNFDNYIIIEDMFQWYGKENAKLYRKTQESND